MATTNVSWKTYAKVIIVAMAAAFVGTLAALATWQGISERREASRLAEAKQRTEDEMRSPAGRQREAVRQVMFDPASAAFRDEHPSRAKASFWCGEVNGKNRMGGMVGFTRYVVDLHADPELSVLDVAHLEPSSDSKNSDEQVRFIAYWSGYCQ